MALDRFFRISAIAALASAFIQVTLGGIVRVTGSGLGCPDWPLCHGEIIPPFEISTLIEYSHRLSASVLIILVLIIATISWRHYRSNYWILISSFLALIFVIIAAVLGGITVFTKLSSWLVLAHLGIAEATVLCLVAVVVASCMNANHNKNGSQLIKTDKITLLTIITLVSGFILILYGSYMVGQGAGSSCNTWPLCKGSLMPSGFRYAIHMGHRYLSVIVAILIIITAFSSWKTRKDHHQLMQANLILIMMFFVQIIIGAITVWSGFTAEMRALHLSAATLVWIALGVVASLEFSRQRFNPRRLFSTTNH